MLSIVALDRAQLNGSITMDLEVASNWFGRPEMDLKETGSELTLQLARQFFDDLPQPVDLSVGLSSMLLNFISSVKVYLHVSPISH